MEWDKGSPTLDKYQVRISDDDGATWNPDWTDIPHSDSDTTEHRATSLTGDTEYTFQLRAVSPRGGGAAAELTASTTAAARTDSTLSSITVDGTAVIRFDPTKTSYHHGVGHSANQITLDATTTDDLASWTARTRSGTLTDADPDLDGLQINLAAGSNEILVSGVAEDLSTKTYTLFINRGTDADYGWKASDDFDNITTAGTTGFNAMSDLWAYGDTLWVVDKDDAKIYAFDTADKTRKLTEDFETLDADNDNPSGIWSDGATMWVKQFGGESLLAYNLSTKARDSDKDITLESEEETPINTLTRTIWSDGAIMWVAGVGTPQKINAFNLSDGIHLPSRDIETGLTGITSGIWSDGETIWLSDVGTNQYIQAYNIDTRQRDPAKDFKTPRAADNTGQSGIWSDGETMWVIDDAHNKVYSYNMPQSDNDELRSLTIGGRGVTAFRAGHYDYQHGVAHDTAQVTIEPEPFNNFATVAYSVDDADDTEDGHQMELSEGHNALTITVTAQNGTDTQDYTVSVNRGTDADFAWQPEQDFDNSVLLSSNTFPFGIWSDGTTMWVTDPNYGIVRAYDTHTREYLPEQNFDMSGTGERYAHFIWSDGATMWVSNYQTQTLYAYDLVSKARDSSRDIDIPGLTGDSDVFTSDGTTLWVQTDNKLGIATAYKLSTLERQPRKDLDMDSNISALWTDGTTMWARRINSATIVAYSIHDGSEQTTKYIQTTASGGIDAQGLWSNGSTIWASDYFDDKIYAYRMPAASDTSIGVLTVNGEDVAGLHPDEIDHQHGVANTVTQATVLAKPMNRFATLEFNVTDADLNTDGFQINLSAVRNRFEFTITAANGDRKTQTVSINQGVTADFGWRAVDDLDGVMTVAGNDYPAALWSNGTTFWISDTRSPQLYAYDVESMVRDPHKDFPELDEDNGHPRGMSSDGTTMWLVDRDDKKLYAYDMETKSRDSGKDFNTLEAAGNENPMGAWTDGTTMWVSETNSNNTANNKLYAYNVATKAPDSDKDFDTLVSAGNRDPRSMWSDGTTMWVGDDVDRKIYAYNMETKARDSAKDFNTLNAADNDFQWGMWSNRSVMWVVDHTDSKLYSYNMDRPAPNNLAAQPGSRRVSLTWDDPSNATIVKYQFRIILNADPSTAQPWFDIPHSGPDRGR